MSKTMSNKASKGWLENSLPREDVFNHLKTRNELYKTILQSASDGFFIDDYNGNILDVNDAFCDMLGYSRDELLSMTIMDIDIHGGNIKVINKLHDRLSKISKGTLEETRHIRKDGSIIDVSVSFKYLDISPGFFFCFTRDITPQKKVLRQLKESENLYRSLIELGTKIGEAVITLRDIEGKEGIHIYASDQWPRITGYSKEELLSMSFFDLVSPRYRKASMQRHRYKMAGKSISDLFEINIIHKSGVEIPIELTSAATDYEGAPTNVIYIREVKERKKLMKSLEEKEERLRTIVQSISDIIIILDEDGRYIDILTGSNELLYQKKQDVRGLLLHEVLPEDIADIGLHSIKQVIKTKKSKVIEYRLTVPAGDRWFQGVISPLKSKVGNKLVVMVTRDITERIQSEEKHRHIIEISTDGFFIADKNLNYLEVNDAYCHMMGYTREELLGMSIADIEALRTPEQLIGHSKQIMKEGSFIFETKNRKKDGRLIDVEVAGRYLGTGEKQFFTFVRDITKRKQINKRLKQYQNHLEDLVKERTAELTAVNKKLKLQIKHRGDFLKALVHELKTPLTPLIGASEILLNNTQDKELKRTAINVHRGARNLDKRINDLINLAKGEMGVLEIECKPVNLLPMFNEVFEYVKPVAERNRQNITLDIPASLPTFLADSDRLFQVMLNLLDNAIKFTPALGEINIKVEVDNSELIVHVKDTGCGVPHDSIPDLFEPYSIVAYSNNVHDGLGIGLPLSKMLVKAHGGKIFVESEKNIGSTFSFSIPINQTIEA